MSIAIGTTRLAAPRNVHYPENLDALSGCVKPGDAVVFGGRTTIAITVTVFAPNTHPDSTVKPHLSAVRVVTPHGTKWIGSRFAMPYDDGLLYWDRVQGLRQP